MRRWETWPPPVLRTRATSIMTTNLASHTTRGDSVSRRQMAGSGTRAVGTPRAEADKEELQSITSQLCLKKKSAPPHLGIGNADDTSTRRSSPCVPQAFPPRRPRSRSHSPTMLLVLLVVPLPVLLVAAPFGPGVPHAPMCHMSLQLSWSLVTMVLRLAILVRFLALPAMSLSVSPAAGLRRECNPGVSHHSAVSNPKVPTESPMPLLTQCCLGGSMNPPCAIPCDTRSNLDSMPSCARLCRARQGHEPQGKHASRL